ncbi:GTP cyclohydrolase [Hyunsoonleella rubra]|uniref:GTP cyclohydrolase n=1 Tax=Hyunsoonleella rubra TaxID=1737062 RepID=A0ABW5TBR7_9FLAO
MISIKEVTTKKDLKAFVKFPFKLYKDSKYWTPPIISQEMKTFDKDENPVFLDANAQLFLAYRNNEIVGRVAAIVNWLEVKKQNERRMRFGWFDFIDDLEVSQALFDKVESIGKAHDLEFTEGPLGFSNLDKVGVIDEGYEALSPMVTWYNHPYYIKHYEAAGYHIEKAYVESRFEFSNVKPETFLKANELIKKRYQLKPLNFTKTKEVMPYVDGMFDLFNETYAGLSSFVEVTDIQKDYFKKKFISFVNPEYIKFIMDKDDKPIAFAVVMPSFAKALQKAKGKLFPFGLIHILKARKNSKEAIFYLIGIHPDYQNKGVHALIFNEYYNTLTAKGVKTCYRTPELADNIAIRQIWKHFNPEVFRKRKTYRKELK